MIYRSAVRNHQDMYKCACARTLKHDVRTEDVAGVEGLAGHPLAVVNFGPERPPGGVADEVRRPRLGRRGGHRQQEHRHAQERGTGDKRRRPTAACGTASSPSRRHGCCNAQ